MNANTRDICAALRRWSYVGFALLALPATALAEEAVGAGHGEPHGEVHFELTNVFLGALVNFTVLVLLFVWFGKRKLIPYLAQRRKGVEDGLEEAARLTAQAEAAHKEYADKLAGLEDELAKVRAELKAAGEEDKQRLVAEAEARAERMRRDAELLIEQQMAELRASVTREVVEAAMQAAQEVLTSSVKPADQERLAKAYLAELRAALGPTAHAAPAQARPVRQQEEHA